MEKNLTTGSVPKTMAYFALPYLLSYFLQTLYGMADLFIIGQFCGKDAGATTAVANGSQVMHMLTVILVGLAMGTTVVIGKAVGAKKLQDAQAAIGNTVTIFMIISVVLTVMLLIFINPIVAVMDTPEEAVKGITDYLIVCFIGIPFITAYNVISSIFRGLGDSKSPMYFIAVACGLNIALDYIFIGACGMGPIGAALGTTLAQTFSVIISFVAIRRMNTGLRIAKNDFVPRRSVLGEIVKIGLPVAVQDGCIQIAFIVITVIANNRGVNDAAAVGVVEKMISFIFIVPSSMSSSTKASLRYATFCSLSMSFLRCFVTCLSITSTTRSIETYISSLTCSALMMCPFIGMVTSIFCLSFSTLNVTCAPVSAAKYFSSFESLSCTAFLSPSVTSMFLPLIM